jgi:Dolichyl-phosphate-mannose-protein mannosyltransferase
MAAIRRPPNLVVIALLAATLHAAGIAAASLPAQDGLKFIRVARAFQTQPWADVVRGTDQHPLYPAFVAALEPAAALVAGHGPDTWRIAAQLVAAIAAVGLIWPLHGLARELFGLRVADLATLGFVLLPLPMAVGHDTLSDSLALAAFLVSLRLGLSLLRAGGWRAAIGCGLAAGLGFLARPEVLVAPVAVVAAGVWRSIRVSTRREDLAPGTRPDPSVPFVSTPTRSLAPRLGGLAVVFLAMVGGYALVKGEVSEKLALRSATSLGPTVQRLRGARPVTNMLPLGLDDPRWDFSPKEEPARTPRRSVGEVAGDLVFHWSEGLGWILALFAVWGLVRDRTIRRRLAGGGPWPDADNAGRLLVLAYLVPFTLVLARHELTMGYLSHRHVLTLVMLSLPWAAAGVLVCAGRAAEVLRLGRRPAWVLATVAVALAVATGVTLQLRPSHQSRWGHRKAGEWLGAHAGPGEAVLDTRGWAAFVSGRPSYDYWHVRQALSDKNLAYVVAGDDELRSGSRRAATLRALLAYAAEPVAGFPDRRGGHGVGVHVYRYHRPESWEGLRR